MQVNAAAVQEKEATAVDWDATAKELDSKSPLEIMDHVRPAPGPHTDAYPQADTQQTRSWRHASSPAYRRIC